MDKANIEFDYGQFLSCEGVKAYTFSELVRSIVALMVGQPLSEQHNTKCDQALFSELATPKLSLRNSDEKNIVKLCTIAKSEGITTFKLLMPYNLDDKQVYHIESKCHVELRSEGDDEFTVLL